MELGPVVLGHTGSSCSHRTLDGKNKQNLWNQTENCVMGFPKHGLPLAKTRPSWPLGSREPTVPLRGVAEALTASCDASQGEETTADL